MIPEYKLGAQYTSNMEFHLNDRYKDLPEKWPKYHNGEQIGDIKVYKDTEWTVVTNGFCDIHRPILLEGNNPEQGPVIDHKKGKEDWQRYSTILYPEKVHLDFEHNKGIGCGFTAILSKEEAREIGEKLIAASMIDDIRDGNIQGFRALIGAPQWIINLQS